MRLQYRSFSRSTLGVEASPFDIAHLIDTLLQGLRTFDSSDNVLALINLLLADAAMCPLSTPLTPETMACTLSSSAPSACLPRSRTRLSPPSARCPRCSAAASFSADDACAHLLRVARRVVSTVFDEGRACRGTGR